jgi:hypothetical protein
MDLVYRMKRSGARARSRERGGGWLRKGWGVGHKLDHWSSIYEGFIERIIQEFIKMAIRLIPRISDGQYFSQNATTFNPSDKLTLHHTT